jgi:hypothetical protein
MVSRLPEDRKTVGELSMTRKFVIHVFLAAAFVSAALPAGAAARVSTAAAPKEPAVCPADDSAVGPGLRAFLDPQTGQLREPTPEEARALAAAARIEVARAIESLEAVVHPDGMISLDLKGLFDQNLVVVRGPDGSLSMRCVEGPEIPVALTSPLPPKPARPLEER